MKIRLTHYLMATLIAITFTAESHAQTTAFTYQGQLTKSGSPATGLYDFTFSLWDNATGPSQVGPMLGTNGLAVSNGLFTVRLDFGSGVFDGSDRWLEVAVVTNGGGVFTNLSPRQQITSTPYAVKALEAAGVPLGTITGEMLAPGAVSMLGTPDGSDTNVLQVTDGGLIGIGATDPNAGLYISSTGSILTASVLFEVQDGTDNFTNLAGASGLALSGDLLAVAAQSDDAVTFLNVSNPAAPVILSQVRDGNGAFTNLSGAFGVAISGNLVAVAGRNENAVTLIDVSDPANPVRRGEMRDGVGGFNELADAVSVAFSGNLLAIASSIDNAVTLVDVSDPDNPSLLVALKDGTFGFNELEGAFHVALQGNLLAIAAVFDDAVTLVDVSTPSNPQLRAVLKDGVGGFDELQGAIGVELSGSTLAISSIYDNAVTLVDVSTPASPVLLSVIKDGAGGVGSLQGPRGLSFSGDLLAIAALLENAVTLVDISDPGNPAVRGAFHHGQAAVHFMAVPYAVVFVDGKPVVAAGGSDALTVFDPVPASVSLVSEERVGIGTSVPAATLHVAGDLLVAGDEVGLRAIRVGLGSGIATGEYATAMGVQTTASGDRSTAMGDNTTASGNTSTAMGRDTTASGFYSTAMGFQSAANSDYTFAAGVRAKAIHAGAFVWADSQIADFSSTAPNAVGFRCGGGVRFTSGSGGGNQTVSWSPGDASWTFTSDRALKENFDPVDAAAMLESVSRLPLHQWNYIGYAQRHLGPMAQDFHAAFPWSGDGRTLNSADLDGVALAAIQGLNEKVETGKQKAEMRIQKLEDELKRRDVENAELKQRLEKLEHLLSDKLNGGAK